MPWTKADKGYLTFSDVTLKVYSDAVPVTAVDDYHLNAQINGNVTQTHSGTAVHATAVQMRVGLTAVLDEGWLAFETIRLTSLSAPITAQPEQYHQLTAQVSGQLNSAGDGRLSHQRMIRMYNPHNLRMFYRYRGFI